jgi:hypothetical protein
VKKKRFLVWNLISLLGGFDILFIPGRLIGFPSSNLMSLISVCGGHFTLVKILEAPYA